MASEEDSPFGFIKDESHTNMDKLKKKMMEDPFVPIGVLGGLGALGWGVYTYRSRGNMSTSIFLMRLRVVAQGMVVGAMTLGVGVSLAQRYYKNHHK